MRSARRDGPFLHLPAPDPDATWFVFGCLSGVSIFGNDRLIKEGDTVKRTGQIVGQYELRRLLPPIYALVSGLLLYLQPRTSR